EFRVFVSQAGREAAHQMNANVPDLRLLERACRNRRRRAGRVELPAVILDPGDQISAVALELNRNFEQIVPCGPIHDDIGDRLFKAGLYSEGDVRRSVNPSIQPARRFNSATSLRSTRRLASLFAIAITMPTPPLQRLRSDGSGSVRPCPRF